MYITTIFLLSLIGLCFGQTRVVLDSAQFEVLLKTINDTKSVPTFRKHSTQQPPLFDSDDASFFKINGGDCKNNATSGLPLLCYTPASYFISYLFTPTYTRMGAEYGASEWLACANVPNTLPTIYGSNTKDRFIQGMKDLIDHVHSMILRHDILYYIDFIGSNTTAGATPAYIAVRPTNIVFSTLSEADAETLDTTVTKIIHSIFATMDFTREDYVDPLILSELQNPVTQFYKAGLQSDLKAALTITPSTNILGEEHIKNVSFINGRTGKVQNAFVRNTTLHFIGFDLKSDRIVERVYTKVVPYPVKISQTNLEDASYRPAIQLALSKSIFYAEWAYAESFVPVFAFYVLERAGKMQLDLPFYPFLQLSLMSAKDMHAYCAHPVFDMQQDDYVLTRNYYSINPDNCAFTTGSAQDSEVCFPFQYAHMNYSFHPFSHFDMGLSTIGKDVHNAMYKMNADIVGDNGECDNPPPKRSVKIAVVGAAFHTFLASGSVSGVYKPYLAIKENTLSDLNGVLKALPPSTLTNSISTLLDDVEVTFGHAWEMAGRVFSVAGDIEMTVEEIVRLGKGLKELWSILMAFAEILPGFLAFETPQMNLFPEISGDKLHIPTYVV